MQHSQDISSLQPLLRHLYRVILYHMFQCSFIKSVQRRLKKLQWFHSASYCVRASSAVSCYRCYTSHLLIAHSDTPIPILLNLARLHPLARADIDWRSPPIAILTFHRLLHLQQGIHSIHNHYTKSHIAHKPSLHNPSILLPSLPISHL